VGLNHRPSGYEPHSLSEQQETPGTVSRQRNPDRRDLNLSRGFIDLA